METGFLGLFSCFTVILFILSIIFFIDCLTKTYIITNERIIFKTPFKNYELNFDKIESISNDVGLKTPDFVLTVYFKLILNLLLFIDINLSIFFINIVYWSELELAIKL